MRLVMIVLCVLLAGLVVGCRSATETAFLGADVEISTKYAELAHPAAIQYAEQLIAAGGDDAALGKQLKVNLSALLMELHENAR